MSPFAKYLLFIEKTKFRKSFYLSPFVVMVLVWIPILWCKFILGFVIFWPISVAIVYFLLWIVLMHLHFYFTVGPDSKIQRRKFVRLSEVFNNIRREAKRNGWTIKEGIKAPLSDLGFTIEGIEDGVKFIVEIVNSPLASNNSAYGALPSSGIYIATKKGEDFEISLKDILENIEATGVKAKFIELGKSDLLWLIKENQYIQTISFKNASMGALINEYFIASSIKEIISRLVHIVKIYSQVY